MDNAFSSPRIARDNSTLLAGSRRRIGLQARVFGTRVANATVVHPDGTSLIVSDNFGDTIQFLSGHPAGQSPCSTPLRGASGQRVPGWHWLVYESNESGDRFEIFVRPFPKSSGRREQVSLDGGRHPRWSRTSAGLEIVYITLEGAMTAVPVSLSPALSLGRQ